MESAEYGHSVKAHAKRAGFLTLKEARQYFVTNPSLNGIRKWMKIGVHNRTVKDGQGPRIKLRSLREGAFWLTRLEWIKEFQLACDENVKGWK